MSEEEKKIVEEVEKLNRKEKKQIKALEEQVAKLAEKLEASTKEADEWKNKYYGVFADMENSRKQNDKDKALFIKYRAMGFIEKLLPILDGFHIATSHIPDDIVLKNYLTGFTFIYKQLVEAMASEGVTEIAPKIGEIFDAKHMHAIDTVYDPDKTPHSIAKVYANGYLLHDRMVRAATVVVTTDIKEEAEPETATTPENIDLN